MNIPPAARRLLLTLTFLACLIPVSRAADDKPAENLETLIFDRNAFVSHLPKLTLVGVNDRSTKEQVAAMRHALAKLGKVPVEYVMLPKGVAAPAIKDWVTPDYPRNLPRPTDPHQASFLVLVGGEGRPLLMFCTEATERDVAVAAAKAIVRWTYTPTTLGGHVVPVLIEVDAVVPPNV